MHTGDKRNLSEVEGQSLPRNPTDRKCIACIMNFCSALCGHGVMAMFEDNDYACFCPKMSIDIGPSISEDTGG